MIRLSFCLFILSLILQSTVFNSFYGARSAEKTSRLPAGPMHIEEYGTYNAAEEISEKAHIAIGVEAIQPAKERTVVLNFQGGTVGDLLNMLTATSQDYSWDETEGGVIHLARTGARVALLDVTISYPGAYKKTRQEIWENITDIPEISAWMKSNACSRQQFLNGKEFKKYNDPIYIAPGSMTVRQLLDTVAVKSGSNYWAVLQSPPTTGDCHITIW